MGRLQQHVHHTEPSRFPPDFPERLDRLPLEPALSWRGLARALRVDARTLRRWRTGTAPGPGHLYRLFVFALERGLLHCLMLGAAGALTRREECRPSSPCGGDRAGGLRTGGDA